MIDIASEPYRGEESYDFECIDESGKEYLGMLLYDWCEGAESQYTIYWHDESFSNEELEQKVIFKFKQAHP